MQRFKKAHISDFADTLPKHWSPKTRKVALGHLHALLSDAAEDYEGIVQVPSFPKIQIPDHEVLWLDEEWQEKILAEIPDHDRPIFILMRRWGVRPGEARALKWDCIDFVRGVITIKRTFSGAGCNHLKERTKTRLIRYLPITEDIKAILEEVRRRPVISQFVFINEHGRPYTADVSRIWNEARKKAGCTEEATLYEGTKHSFVTQNLDQMDLVREAVGHTDLKTTRLYKGVNVGKLRLLGTKQKRHDRNGTATGD